MANQNFRIRNGLEVGVNGTIITTTGIGSVGIGSTQPTATLDVVGDVSVSGAITATTFVKSGGTSSQFLKADGSVDSSTYATQAYVGLATAGLASVSYVDNKVGLATVGLLSQSGNGSNLTGIVTSIVAGQGISVDQSTGKVTVSTAVTATEHKILDDISSSFNGSATQFTISSSFTNFLNSEITNAARLLISVGGVVQAPDPTQNNGYYISGGTNLSTDPIKINFVEAPKAGQAFFGVAYGLAVSPTTSFVTSEESIAYSILFGV